MWTYEQRTGKLGRPGFVFIGYSGFGVDKNIPASQNKKNLGPIPVGMYSITGPENVDKPGPHGPYVLRLTPDPENEMFDRDGFLIHGDSIAHPGTASQGCIIMARNVREMIFNSGDHRLQVVSGAPAPLLA